MNGKCPTREVLLRNQRIGRAVDLQVRLCPTIRILGHALASCAR